MKQKQIVTTIFTLIILLFGCIGCEKKNDDVIRIGAILPLTGNLAYLGEEEKNVLTILQEQINETEDTKVLFMFEDSKGNARDGLTAYNKLRSQNVNYYITSLTIVARAVAPLIDRNNHLQFVLSIDPSITPDYSNTIQLYYNIADEMNVIADYI
ncbi:MAG TPA: amino acid ABC transporter substrate-binding protein, partial [Bacteroidaceae bacterium]|nr:amino acid ABC transporter substrate-binding protein [Bacteroidaceae bacterium]